MDQITDTVITIDPAGNIGANFTGHVHAAGIDLDAETGLAPPDKDKVRWLSTINSAVVGAISSFAQGIAGLDQSDLTLALTRLGGKGRMRLDAGGGIVRLELREDIAPAVGRRAISISCLLDDDLTTVTRKLISSDGKVDFALPFNLLVDGTVVDVVSDNSERTLCSTLIAAGALGTKNGVRVTLDLDYLNNSGVNQTSTFRIKYGATTLWGDAPSIATNAARRNIRFVIDLFNANATGVQNLTGDVGFGVVTLASVAGIGTLTQVSNGGPISGTSVEDSTLAKTLAVTVQHTNNLATLSTRVKGVQIELLS